MIPKRDLLFPPAVVIEDQRSIYQRQLREARSRQAQRDLEHDAYIDNLFWGEPYVNILEEYPWLAVDVDVHETEVDSKKPDVKRKKVLP